MDEVKGEWINDVLRIVSLRSTNGDVQLTILARALVLAARVLGADRETLLKNVADAFDAEPRRDQ